MLQATAVAFATLFVAELGDKSQLLALSLSARYRRPVLLAAVMVASGLTMGLSVALGAIAGLLVPTRVLTVGAGVLFLVFAGITFRRAAVVAPDRQLSRPPGGFLTAVAAMAVAELGDKTMLAAITLAATTSASGVWLGGTLGMSAAGAIAVLIGSSLWRRFSPRTVRLATAAMFALVGLLLLVDALT